MTITSLQSTSVATVLMVSFLRYGKEQYPSSATEPAVADGPTLFYTTGIVSDISSYEDVYMSTPRQCFVQH